MRLLRQDTSVCPALSEFRQPCSEWSIYTLTVYVKRKRWNQTSPLPPLLLVFIPLMRTHTEFTYVTHKHIDTYAHLCEHAHTHTMSCIHALVTLLSLTQSILLCVLMVYLLLVLLLVDALQKLYVVSGVEFHHLLLLRLFGWNNTGTESKSQQCHEYAVQWPGTESVSE